LIAGSNTIKPEISRLKRPLYNLSIGVFDMTKKDRIEDLELNVAELITRAKAAKTLISAHEARIDALERALNMSAKQEPMPITDQKETLLEQEEAIKKVPYRGFWVDWADKVHEVVGYNPSILANTFPSKEEAEVEAKMQAIIRELEACAGARGFVYAGHLYGISFAGKDIFSAYLASPEAFGQVYFNTASECIEAMKGLQKRHSDVTLCTVAMRYYRIGEESLARKQTDEK